MVSKKSFINNFFISNNVSLFKDFSVNKRALVLDRVVSGLESVAVKDFYHVVILETRAGLASVPVPDFIFYQEESPYVNNVFLYDQLFVNKQSLLVTNYNAVQIFSKLNRELEAFNVNYLPSGQGISNIVATERLIQCGLNSSHPGVHLASIMGCTSIYYTGISDSSTQVGLSDIVAFTTAQDRLTYKNIISVNRQTILIADL